MDQIDRSGPNWIAANKTKVEKNTKLNRSNVKSGIDGYGLSSWIRGQLVLQWKRENNRENNRKGNKEKENINWEQSSHSSFCTTSSLYTLD